MTCALKNAVFPAIAQQLNRYDARLECVDLTGHRRIPLCIGQDIVNIWSILVAYDIEAPAVVVIVKNRPGGEMIRLDKVHLIRRVIRTLEIDIQPPAGNVNSALAAQLDEFPGFALIPRFTFRIIVLCTRGCAVVVPDFVDPNGSWRAGIDKIIWRECRRRI